MKPLLEEMIGAAVMAGAEIERIYAEGCEAEEKMDGSLVTVADRNAEAIILERLGRAFPDIPVLAEEEVAAGRIPDLGDRFFCLDPLDGTRGFVRRTGEFAVSLALVEEGVATAGVIYAPVTRALHCGALGEGAFRRLEGAGPEPIRTRPPPSSGLIALTSRTTSDRTAKALAHLDIAEFRPSSSALKFCELAEGAADLYPRFGRTMEWDTAAGQAIVEAAGGRVVEVDEAGCELGPLRYRNARGNFENPYFIAWGA